MFVNLNYTTFPCYTMADILFLTNRPSHAQAILYILHINYYLFDFLVNIHNA